MNLARLIFAEPNPENSIVEMIESSRQEISPEMLAAEYAARKLVEGSEFSDLESILYYLADQRAEFDHDKALETAESAMGDIAEDYLREINGLSGV